MTESDEEKYTNSGSDAEYFTLGRQMRRKTFSMSFDCWLCQNIKITSSALLTGERKMNSFSSFCD